MIVSPPAKRRGPQFRVIRTPDGQGPSHRVNLSDLPDDLIIHIFSYLSGNSFAAVARVSRRFNELVRSPAAWRMAFFREFTGQDVTTGPRHSRKISWDDGNGSDVRAEFRFFTRLTAKMSWNIEYILRTSLLRGLASGRPARGDGAVGSVGNSSKSGRASAGKGNSSSVITYDSKLLGSITHIDAIFSSGARRGPQVYSGCAAFGIAGRSDPTTGRVDQWGIRDWTSWRDPAQPVPAAGPNANGVAGAGAGDFLHVMDVSREYGVVAAEGSPDGRIYHRHAAERVGRFLTRNTGGIMQLDAEFPNVQVGFEGVSAVWIAKSPDVPIMTESMIGILVGSTKGVLSAFSVGTTGSGPRYSMRDCTAIWVLSPGVPIVSIKVDDNYSFKKKASGRVWAVVLNALGEVFYLTETPSPVISHAREASIETSWQAGRTARWHLLDATRRKPAVACDISSDPDRALDLVRTSSNSMRRSREDLIAESEAIEDLLLREPQYFMDKYIGWDPTRRMEVDFAGGDGRKGGEAIVVISRGFEPWQDPEVRRLRRSVHHEDRSSSLAGKTLVTHGNVVDSWSVSVMSLESCSHAPITTSAIDMSIYALTTAEEDEQHQQRGFSSSDGATTPHIPGNRARMLAVGTKSGAVVIWNARDVPTAGMVLPRRIIQTDSPEVTCVALSSLYVVHGGSDGLVQAWDPLASTLQPVRTIHSRAPGRVPRQVLNNMPAEVRQAATTARVGAIFLDADATRLRGVLAIGCFLRYWSYDRDSSDPGAGSSKRRRRAGGAGIRRRSRNAASTASNRALPADATSFPSFIAGEQAEAKRKRLEVEAALRRLSERFGVDLGGTGAAGPGHLTMSTEDALHYALLLSREAYERERMLREVWPQGSDADSSGGTSPSSATSSDVGGGDGDAARLQSSSSPPTGPEDAALATGEQPLAELGWATPSPAHDDEIDEDLATALRLSLLDYQQRAAAGDAAFHGIHDEEFPPLGKAGPSTGSGGGRGGSMGKRKSTWDSDI